VLVSGSRVVASNFGATAKLDAFAEMLRLGAVRGDVSIRLDSFELVGGLPQTASGTLRIANLAAAPPIPVPGVRLVQLGDYQARIGTDGEPGIVALISDERGPVEFEGQLRISPDRTWTMDSRVRPRSDAPDVLVQGLQFMAPTPNADGQYQISDRGTW
jgi:hypothetical protein